MGGRRRRRNRRERTMSRITFVILAALALATVSQAQLIFPIEQERHLEASVTADNYPEPLTDSQSADAPDMQPWAASIEAAVGVPDLFDLTAGAGQYSEIGTTTLSAYGWTEFEAQLFPVLPYSEAVAESRCIVRFAVAEPVTYEISGTIAASADVTGEPLGGWWTIDAMVSMRLDQIAGPVVHDQQAYVALAWDPDEPLVDSQWLADVGELSPGVYELEIVATVNAPGFCADDPELATLLGETTYVVNMAVAAIQPNPDCEGHDTDGDGDVDLLDFSHLQQCFTGP